MDAQPRAGSLDALVVVWEAEVTRRRCLRDPSGQGSTHPQAQADSVEASVEDSAAAEVEEVSEEASVGIASDPGEVSATKVVAMDSVDKLPLTPHQALEEDAADSEAVETDSTEASLAATVSQFVPETVMRTETVATTAMVTVTETVTVETTAMEIATETVIVTANVIDMAVAGKTMGVNDTVKMMVMMTPAPGDVTKCFVPKPLQ